MGTSAENGWRESSRMTKPVLAPACDSQLERKIGAEDSGGRMASPVRGWRRAKLRYCRCSSTPARVELSWLPTHSLEWCSRPRAQRLTKLVVARQRAHAADRRPRLSSPVKPDLLAAADVLDEAGEPRLRRPEQLDDPSRPGGLQSDAYAAAERALAETEQVG